MIAISLGLSLKQFIIEMSFMRKHWLGSAGFRLVIGFWLIPHVDQFIVFNPNEIFGREV